MSLRRMLVASISAAMLAAFLPATYGTAAKKGRCDDVKAKIGGTTENDRLKGSKKNDVIVSGKGKDRVRTGKGDDRACTGSGNDRAKGGAGNDYLDGGKGKDRLNGGAGADFCINGERVTGCEDPLTLHIDDHLGYLSEQDESATEPEEGETITTTLRAANGLAGAEGYVMSTISPQPYLSGNTTNIDFTGSIDDGSKTVNLPFAVPFFGVSYDNVNVSTNGWAQFGAGAREYPRWQGTLPTAQELGEFFRGVMPWWSDLTLQPTDGSDDAGIVRLVVAPDGNSFAIQWVDVSLFGPTEPERDLQVVFFRDGSIRFDYPGPNSSGGTEGNHDAIVALTGGNGPGTLHQISYDTFDVPDNSFLFTPNEVPQGDVDAGTVTATLPAGSAFVSADPPCSLTTAPTSTAAGLVTCVAPALGSGGHTKLDVRWTLPSGDPLESQGSYQTTGLSAADVESTRNRA